MKSNYGWINLKSKTLIEFVINNFWAQSNNLKFNKYTKSGRKYADIADLIYCEINGIAPSFCLVLSAAYSEFSQVSRKEHFAKMVNEWIPLTVFAKSFISDVWLDFEHFSIYPGLFSIIVNWNYHFEPPNYLFNVISEH